MANHEESLQGELFSRFAGPSKQGPPRSKFNLKALGKITLVIPYENLVFLSIVMIMAFVLSFSLGVEHGKHFLAHLSEPEKDTFVIEQDATTPDISDEAIPAKIKIETQPANEPERPVEKKVNPSKHGYTIQLITFKGKESAEKELDALEKGGYAPFINTRKGLYEICVGRYPDTQSAKPTLAKLRQSKWYHDAFVKNLH